MKEVHGTRKAYKSAQEDDFISNMPDNVITNIMDRLPTQDAVRTSILSRNWRFKWTLLTQLVFDDTFYEYLEVTRGGIEDFDGSTISRLLLLLKGAIKKFVLHIPSGDKLFDDADVNYWVMFLSRIGIKELTLINHHQERLKLSTHLFSCLELKYLKIHNCIIRPSPCFRGFPNLLSLELSELRFHDYKCRETSAQSPLLENLLITDYKPGYKVKLVEITKLENLKMFSLSLCLLHNMSIIRLSSIFQQMSLIPKLEALFLNFKKCKFLPEVGVHKRFSTTFPCLKSLTLDRIDFSSASMLSCTFGVIFGSPNLQTLKITARYKNDVPPRNIWYSEVHNCRSTIGQLQLRNVVLESIKGLEDEICLIKCILANAPLLEKMSIRPNSSLFCNGGNREFKFATKLLKLHRASPIAEIDLCLV